jgi:hypothetical protein
VRHGELEDCYFLASLIILTEQSDLIRGIFTESVENEVGVVDAISGSGPPHPWSPEIHGAAAISAADSRSAA